MCLPDPPKAPAAAPPPAAPAAPQLADLVTLRKQRQLAPNLAGGSLLTGPTGIENSQLSLGKTSLLGG